MIVTNPEIVCDLDRLWSALLRIQVQPSSIFESLPQRIIYFIFDNLDYDDLVVCKEVRERLYYAADITNECIPT